MLINEYYFVLDRNNSVKAGSLLKGMIETSLIDPQERPGELSWAGSNQLALNGRVLQSDDGWNSVCLAIGFLDRLPSILAGGIC